MKKNGILNSDISAVLSAMGHTDTIVICDAGLPIPMNVARIDLSVRRGCPTMIEVLTEILQDMVVEQATLARELQENVIHHAQIRTLLKNIPLRYLPHAEFKEHTRTSRAIIRTGDITPYSNIILHSGVFF